MSTRAVDPTRLTTTIRLTGTCNGPRHHKVHYDHTVTRPLGTAGEYSAEAVCPKCQWLAPVKGSG